MSTRHDEEPGPKTRHKRTINQFSLIAVARQATAIRRYSEGRNCFSQGNNCNLADHAAC